jgi:hypothetical protein
MSENLNNVTILEMEEAHYDKTCPAKAFQQATVCVPVTVVPFAEAGKPKTTCCGDPIIMPGKDTCCGRPNGTCSFTISQRICVEVPVIFGAKTVVGAPSVECEKVSDKDICKKCDDYKDC